MEVKQDVWMPPGSQVMYETTTLEYRKRAAKCPLTSKLPPLALVKESTPR